MRTLMLAYCLVLALCCSSGATPPPVEVYGYEPDSGALATVEPGCPCGSCQEVRG